ncbi:unnamed protein product, partial [Medioppia subpectinata]
MNSKTKFNALLFTPLRLRDLTLKNRVCVSPMGQCSALDGMPQDFHLAHYGSFALGGVGMVMVEATNVEERGRATPGCTGLWNDTQTDGWKRVTHLIKTLGSVAAIQLAHGGPKASCVPFWEGYQSLADDRGGWPTIGPTAVPFGGPVWKVPQEASQHDIKQITLSWIESAKRAVCAGFQVIELHFAHGYLVSSFLSPITNHRSDNYGGCLENRMRFGLEIARGVRDAIPDCIALGVRLSVTDYHKDGWDLKQSIEFAKQLKQIGIDFLDCSSGGVVLNAAEHPLNTNRAQLEASAIIQQTVGLATAAVGQIVDPLVAEDILQSNGASLIMIGRALLNNPHWAYEAADALNANYNSFKYHKQYEWCIGWTAREAPRYGMKAMAADPDRCDMNDLSLLPLIPNSLAIFCVSTYWEGDPTDNAMAFYNWLLKGDTRLNGVRYAVFGLGNSSYEYFNKMGKYVDTRLEELGATRIHPLGLGDTAQHIDNYFINWKKNLWQS